MQINRKNSILLIALLLTLLISISFVSAQELDDSNNGEVAIDNDESVVIESQDGSDDLSSESNNEELKDSSQVVETIPQVDTGVVSGGVDLTTFNGRTTTGSVVYTVPENQTDLKSAIVVINVYSGSGSESYGLYSNVTLNTNNGLEVLGYETLTFDTNLANDPNVYYVNDHTTKQYSDYQMVYDITDKVKNLSPGDTITVGLENTKIPDKQFDGSIKLIGLFYAYDDGDDDKFTYWLHLGQLWRSSSTGNFNFATQNYDGRKDGISLRTIALSSTLADSYKINNVEIAPTTVTPGSYYSQDIKWDNIGYAFELGSDTNFFFEKNSGSYKTNLALLVAGEPYETEPLTEVYVNYATGSDDYPGTTAGSPFKTIEHALSVIEPNGIIHLSGVNYLDGIDANGLTIDKNVSIIGMGDNAVIDADNNGRIFSIGAYTVNFSNIVFANANVASASDKRGGALWVNGATLTVDNCKFINNTAGASSSYGGAINLKSSTATITNSYFDGNSAFYTGAAINAENNNILLNISNTVFTNNEVINTGWATGGAICSYGTVIIDRSMFYGNILASGKNGRSINQYTTGALTITNSILLDGDLSVYHATPANAVLANNWWGNNDANKATTPKDLGYTNADGSYLYLNMTMYATGMNVGDTATVNINLLSSDGSEFDVPDLPATITATGGTVSVESINLVNGAASLTYTLTETENNAVTADILGFTDTVSLSSEDVVSTAIVYVNATGGSDSNPGNSWDKAFKSIEKAVSAVDEDGTIYVADGFYTLGDSVPAAGISITKNIKIIGESTNAVISGENAKRIFTIAVGYTLNITRLTLTNGRGSYGGAIQIEDGGNTNPIRQGYLIISDSIISNSYAANTGGAIGTNRGSIDNINNVTFIGNSAPTGGVLGSQQKGTITIGDNCKFIENTANGRGSAIYAQGKITTGKNNLFYGNVATGNYGYGTVGGYGFDIGPANVFINNKAKTGGALYLAGNSYSGTGSYCIFINNTDNDGRPIGKQNANRPVTLNNCYWGTNTPDFSTLSNGAITYTNYLVLDITAQGNAVAGEPIVINVDLTKLNNGATADIDSLPSTLPLTFAAVNGNVNPVETTLVNGIGTTTYTPAVMGEGSVTANIYAPVGTLDLNVAPEAGTVFVNYAGGLDTNAGDSWENAVKTIQHALSIVGEGKTIYLADGHYYLDGVDVEGLTIDKNISIVGLGDEIIIDANNTSRIFNIDGLTVNLNNLIFVNANVSNAAIKRGGALYVTNSILNIDNCKFINNTAGTSGSYSGAINLMTSNAVITNSYFENNTAWYGGSAINAQSGNIFVNIQESQFINNRALNTGYAMGGALMIYGDSIINRSVLFNNSLGDKSRANAGQAINYGAGNHVLVNSILIGEGLLTINLGNNAVASLENNWWGNNDTTKDINPKDLGHTNGDVESYLVLSSTLSQENVYAGDLVTITTTLNGNVVQLPAVFDAILGKITPNETSMTDSVVSTYNATTLGDEVITVDVLGIKNEIKFTVKETLPEVEITNVKTQWNDGIYPGVNNTFTITLNNAGESTVEGLVLEVYSDESGELIASYTIESLISGTSTIAITDPTIRPITEQTVWPAAQNNKIRFTFNLMRGQDLVTTRSVDKILAYNGYLNKTYAYGGHDNIINRNFTVTGDIIIATQDESVYMDQYSRFRNETWNIVTPEDAENIRAFLYFNYNWDTSFFPNGWTLIFNDVEITSDHISFERDRGNLGGWGAYDYGLLVFDVSEYYKANEENYFAITKTGNCALYPSTLYVLYDMPNSHVTKEVYFSDICDVFYPNYNMEGFDDKIKFVVDYNGLNLENMTEATWYVFTGSSSMYNNLLFNDKEVENAFIGRTSNSCYALELDVTDSISENNRVWFVSTTRSTTTVAYEQVLVITKMETVETSIEITSIQGNGTISGILKDNAGLGLAGQTIKLTVDGADFATAVTNDAGEFTIVGKNGVNNIIFEANGEFLASSKSITLSDIASDEETNKTISDLEAQLAEAQANATALADELADAKANLTVANETIAGLESDLAVANEKVANLTAQLADITAQLDNKTSEVADLTAQLAEAQANVTALADELANVKSNLTAAEAEIATLEGQLADAQQQVTDLTAQLANANSNITNLTEQLANTNAQLAEAQANATSLASELADAKSNLTAAEAKVANLTAQLAEAQANVTAAEAKVANLTAQLAEAQKQIQNMTSELIPTNIAVSALKIKALNSGNFQVTLTDSKGNVLANKTVSIIINGVTKKVTTDDKGIAKLSVKYSKAGTYNAVVTYMGDKTYAATVATGKITVTKKATKITAPKKKFKVKKKTKKVKITLKSEGKALAKKKVTLTVKGKTFKAKTNSKGVATIKVKLNKRGTFKYKVKFAGDGAYKAVSKKGKILIKK
ncbi:DUF3344 domain-containing protein [Methanobrevibacter sp.]|uniref:DUF3344 domain-containing protein n=1 Tax=Methanobrevibacter sp. TaxID=66852 RepID=UPI0038638247